MGRIMIAGRNEKVHWWLARVTGGDSFPGGMVATSAPPASTLDSGSLGPSPPHDTEEA